MENTTERPSHQKTLLFVLIGIAAALILYYTVMCMMSPGKKLKEIRSEFQAKTEDKNTNEQKISRDSTYLRLLKNKAFLQSRIVMAESDSIYLTLNLPDSTANVEISGVVVQKAKMSSISISKILSGSGGYAVLTMLSSPLTISRSKATIKKEPVMIKMAPKDTSEYKPDIMPDTSITEPVNYIFELDHGIRIYVYQEEDTKFSDRMSRFNFDLRDRLLTTWRSIKSVAVFKVPEYHPFIKVRLPRTDAKIIYRAIPKNGQIAVYS